MSSYYAGLLADVGILLLGALSVYVTLATGQLSLGNAGFMGIGAYLTSYLTVTAGIPLTPALVTAAVASGVVGVFVGFPALRLKGIYLAMATLGFGEMVRSFLLNLDAMGGSGGFHGMRHISNDYIWSWAVAILLLVMILERSQIWLEMRAVCHDETAAELVGLNTTTIKVGAFGFAAAIAAIAGGLFAHHHVYIEPGNFNFERSAVSVRSVMLHSRFCRDRLSASSARTAPERPLRSILSRGPIVPARAQSCFRATISLPGLLTRSYGREFREPFRISGCSPT
jgi:branched-chain amino acid transport system permease protein